MTQTSQLQLALRTRYEPAAYGLFWEVGDGRRADAVAMSLWRSHGHAVHGFELKAHRSDWLRELRSPQKSNEVMGYCDFWWLVAADGVCDDPLELPIGWGLLRLRADGRLHARVRAPRLEPKPMDRHFLSLLVRRAGRADQELVHAEVTKQLVEIDARRTESDRREKERRAGNDFEAKYINLRTELGITDQWVSDADLAAAVRAVLRAGVATTYGSLQNLQQSLTTAGRLVDEALANFKETPEPGGPSA